MRGRTLAVVVGVALVLVVVVVIVQRLGSPPTVVPDPGQPALPLVASTTTGVQSSIVLPMGHLDDPLNTFWQLFLRPTGRSSWVLRTPPGVASNGGLVVAAPPTGALTAGFLTSESLTFSPLARTATGGISWSSGQLPAALVGAPDGLAAAPDGSLLALVSGAGQTVLSSTGSLSSWDPMVSTTALARRPTGCRVTAITAVAFDATGEPLVGASCHSGGRLGLLSGDRSSSGDHGSASWVGVGPSLATAAGPVGQSSVVRLEPTTGGDAGLASEGPGSGTSLVAFWGQGAPTRWTVSSRQPVPSSWRLAATAVGGGGGQEVTALLASGRRRQLATIGGPGGSWVTLPTPPPGTGAVAAVGPETDAFVVSGSKLTVWTLGAGSARWTRSSTITVPVPYGSSS